MDRLTNKTYNDLIECQDCIEASNCYENSCGRIEEAIQRLQEYENLEEQGLILRLPCKIGDTIYKIKWKQIDYGDGVIWDVLDYKQATLEPVKFALCHLNSIGESYFITKEDCEEYLSIKSNNI